MRRTAIHLVHIPIVTKQQRKTPNSRQGDSPTTAPTRSQLSPALPFPAAVLLLAPTWSERLIEITPLAHGETGAAAVDERHFEKTIGCRHERKGRKAIVDRGIWAIAEGEKGKVRVRWWGTETLLGKDRAKL
jgi:hypothetical protein